MCKKYTWRNIARREAVESGEHFELCRDSRNRRPCSRLWHRDLGDLRMAAGARPDIYRLDREDEQASSSRAKASANGTKRYTVQIGRPSSSSKETKRQSGGQIDRIETIDLTPRREHQRSSSSHSPIRSDRGTQRSSNEFVPLPPPIQPFPYQPPPPEPIINSRRSRNHPRPIIYNSPRDSPIMPVRIRSPSPERWSDTERRDHQRRQRNDERHRTEDARQRADEERRRRRRLQDQLRELEQRFRDQERATEEERERRRELERITENLNRLQIREHDRRLIAEADLEQRTDEVDVALRRAQEYIDQAQARERRAEQEAGLARREARLSQAEREEERLRRLEAEEEAARRRRPIDRPPPRDVVVVQRPPGRDLDILRDRDRGAAVIRAAQLRNQREDDEHREESERNSERAARYRREGRGPRPSRIIYDDERRNSPRGR